LVVYYVLTTTIATCRQWHQLTISMYQITNKVRCSQFEKYSTAGPLSNIHVPVSRSA